MNQKVNSFKKKTQYQKFKLDKKKVNLENVKHKMKKILLYYNKKMNFQSFHCRKPNQNKIMIYFRSLEIIIIINHKLK